MRSDHVLALNAETTDFAAKLAGHIKTREEELANLRRLHSALLTTAEHEPPALPSFIRAEDEGFRRVGEAAEAVERRAVRPLAPGPSGSEQAA